MIINSTHKGHAFGIIVAITLLAIALQAGMARAEVIQVNISVDDNNINIQSSRTITVTILSTPDFNASALVNISTVTFMGAPVKKDTGKVNFTNKTSGLIDVVLQFELQNTRVQCVDLIGYLTGETYDEKIIYGSDIIHITSPRGCNLSLSAPNITSFDPPYSPVMNNVSELRNFSIKVNQTVNIFWYNGINGDTIQPDISVNESKYTNSASLGNWFIFAIATNSNGGNASQSWLWIVTRVNTSTTIDSSQNTSASGQNVTFTATVDRAVSGTALGAGTPTGTVNFTDNGVTIGTGMLNSSGQATFSISTLSSGSHSITAVYNGDNNFSASTSPPINQTVVTKETPTITWNNPADITYPAALSEIQLNAIATNATGAMVAGNFTYTPSAGTVLSAGNGQMLSVTFTPTDTSDYNTATKNVTINVLMATPTITWNNPADIVYGTALNSTQLNATASVNGTFTYNPTADTILSAGSQILITAFTPQDTTNYTTASANVNIKVNQAIPIITWATPADITYGTALNGAQLNAEASVPGGFDYNPTLGTVLSAGNDQTLSVTFNPTDSKNYTTASASVTINVNKATPTITWSNPADITYGTALSDSQLDATADVAGNFKYNPDTGTILSAGTQTLSADFTPTDTTNYTGASKDVSLIVKQATSSITWNNPADITYGTTLSNTQLDATSSVAGSFAYNPDMGTILAAGNDQNLGVVFTPEDIANYTTASADVKINVLKAIPAITWNNPLDITYGTALGNTQLNAETSIPGSFAYNPSAGTILEAGNEQILHTDFTPINTENYTNASADVKINVLKASTTTTVASPLNPSVFGQVVNFTATVSTDVGTPGGTVQFKIDDSNFGPLVALLNGSATSIGNSSLSVGTHTITAEYSGDGNFNSSTSSALIQTVNKASTTTPTTTTSSSAGYSSGSSGCGSGVITKENQSNIKQHETREVNVHISKGATVFRFSTLGIVSEAGFTAKTNEGCIAARGEVLKERPSQATSDAAGTGTVYFNVWLGPSGYSESSKIENPYVVFNVPDEKNNESVKLMMYKNNSWMDLKTEKIDTGIYRAYTGGFGSFAIVETTETPFETPAETSTSTSTPVAITNETAPQKPTNLALILVVFILIIGIVIGYRQYRKSLSRKNTNLQK